MSNFLKSGNAYFVNGVVPEDSFEFLPPGTYALKEKKPNGPLYFEAIDDFKMPDKMFGDVSKNTDRILNTFLDRPDATGVMLTGEKGSGKSFLAKNLAAQAAKLHKIPTILINQPWCGETFNTFIQSIKQPMILIFDEFEKVYDRDDQSELLTLLNGVYPSKKLFIFTCNDVHKVSEYMHNRPGRLYYLIEYDGLNSDFIIEYCQYKLKPELQHHINSICSFSNLFSKFNFDMLQALVEEMNRYNEPPDEAIRLLNIKPQVTNNVDEFIPALYINGRRLDSRNLHDNWTGNPLSQNILILAKIEIRDGIIVEDLLVANKDNIGWNSILFELADLKKVDYKTGEFTFEAIKFGCELRLNLKRQQEPIYNFFDKLAL
jgi:hypothetical protein